MGLVTIIPSILASAMAPLLSMITISRRLLWRLGRAISLEMDSVDSLGMGALSDVGCEAWFFADHVSCLQRLNERPNVLGGHDWMYHHVLDE